MPKKISQVSIVPTTLVALLSFGSNAMAHEAAPAKEVHHKMHQSMETMHKDMMSMSSKDDVDQDFVSMMIRHHQGAIDMAQIELAQGKDPQAKEFAKKMIEEQKKEVEQLQNWQKNQPGAKRASK